MTPIIKIQRARFYKQKKQKTIGKRLYIYSKRQTLYKKQYTKSLALCFYAILHGTFEIGGGGGGRAGIFMNKKQCTLRKCLYAKNNAISVTFLYKKSQTLWVTFSYAKNNALSVTFLYLKFIVQYILIAKYKRTYDHIDQIDK